MSMRFGVGVGVLLLALPLQVFAADTLVVNQGGTYKPGLAKSWSQSADGLTLVLQDGTDVQKTAATLRERLAQVKVAVDGKSIVLSGVPAPALLEQLSTLSLTGEADPLAALAGLGGGPQGEAVEGGGSIRASKPTPLAGLPIAREHDVNERAEAEVMGITRGPFPQATLKLRIKKGARAGALKQKLAAGKILELPVVLTGSGNDVDLKDAGNQRNAVAYYLVKGDRVLVHAIEAQGGELAADWIERKQ